MPGSIRTVIALFLSVLLMVGGQDIPPCNMGQVAAPVNEYTFEANGDVQRACPATGTGTNSWSFTPREGAGTYTVMDDGISYCLLPDSALGVQSVNNIEGNGILTVIFTLMGTLINTTLNITYESRGIYSQVSELVDLPDSERVIWRTVGISAISDFIICENDTISDLFEADYEEDENCLAETEAQPLVVRVTLLREMGERDLGIHRVRLVTGSCEDPDESESVSLQVLNRTVETPAPSPGTDPPRTSGGSDDLTAIIAGCVAGALLLIIIVVPIAVFLCWHKKKRYKSTTIGSSQVTDERPPSPLNNYVQQTALSAQQQGQLHVETGLKSNGIPSKVMDKPRIAVACDPEEYKLEEVSKALADMHDLCWWKLDPVNNETLPLFLTQTLTDTNIKWFCIFSSKSREQIQEEGHNQSPSNLTWRIIQHLSLAPLPEQQLKKVVCIQLGGSSRNGYKSKFATIVLDQNPNDPHFSASKCAELVYDEMMKESEVQKTVIDRTLEITPSEQSTSVEVEQPVSAPTPRKLPTTTQPASGPPSPDSPTSAIPPGLKRGLVNEGRPASDRPIRKSPPVTLTAATNYGSVEGSLNQVRGHGSGGLESDSLTTLIKEIKKIAHATQRAADATEKTERHAEKAERHAEKTERHTERAADTSEKALEHLEGVADDTHETRDNTRLLLDDGQERHPDGTAESTT